MNGMRRFAIAFCAISLTGMRICGMASGARMDLESKTEALIKRDPKFADPKTKVEVLKNLEKAENGALWSSENVAKSAAHWAAKMRAKYGLQKESQKVEQEKPKELQKAPQQMPKQPSEPEKKKFTPHPPTGSKPYSDARTRLIEAFASLRKERQTMEINDYELKLGALEDRLKGKEDLVHKVVSEVDALSTLQLIYIYWPKKAAEIAALKEKAKKEAKTELEKADYQKVIDHQEKELVKPFETPGVLHDDLRELREFAIYTSLEKLVAQKK